MQIAYAAHTDACTFFLDDEGICRRVLRLRRTTLVGIGTDEADAAERCLGAQYVASLDFEAKGGLIALPRVGVPMIFAYVAKGGRITLVRTGPVTRFEENRIAKPDSGVRARPSEESIQVLIEEEPESDVKDTLRTPRAQDDEDDLSTHVFRASSRTMRPPPPPVATRPPPPASMRVRSSVPRAATPTPPEGRPSWMPATRVERISFAPPSTIREADPSAPTLREPTPVTSRGRGMLPMRATRGRG